MRRAPLLLGFLGFLLAARAGADGAPHRLPITPTAGARFGSSVAVGEGVLAVGAYLDSTNGKNAGAVYLFHPTADGWGLPVQLTGLPGEQFGYSVAIDGDTLIVGAPFAPGGGAAYRYHLSSLAQESLSLPHHAGAQAGCAVAAAHGTVAVGACRDGSAGTDAGRVYLYVSYISGDPPLQLDGASGGRFGTAVALSPDGGTLVVGAPFSTGAGPAAGAAYVFKKSTSWTRKQLDAAPRAEDAFGYAVAVDDKYIAVGAPLDDDRGQDAGAVYIFKQDDTDWPQTHKVTSGAAGDQLGVSVALEGETILAGARRHGPQRAGAAYRISADSGAVLETLSSPMPGAELGFAVARHGEIDLVGAFLEGNGMGAAYVFEPEPPALPTVQFGEPARSVPESQSLLLLPVTVFTQDQGVTAQPVVVDLTWTNEGARAGIDYRLLTPQLTFDRGSANGDTKSAVVEILNDASAQGNRKFRVSLAIRQGAVLGSFSAVEVTILDDDRAAIETILPATPLLTSESGQTATFKIRLATLPALPVDVTIASDIPTEGTVSPAVLHFRRGNWNRPQTVVVTGVDDSIPDGDIPYTLTLTAASQDPAYNGLSAPPVQVVNLDDEFVTGTERACDLGGGQVLFTFVLANRGPAQPEVDLADILPMELTAMAADSDLGAATIDPLTNQLVWRVALTRGAQATLSLVAAVLPGNVGRPVTDQAVFSFDTNGDGLNDATRNTDDADLSGAPLADHPTTFTIGALRPCFPP